MSCWGDAPEGRRVPSGLSPGARHWARLHMGSRNRHNTSGQRRATTSSHRQAVTPVSCPAQEHRCRCLSRAGHLLLPQCAVFLCQMTTQAVWMTWLAHSSRSWVRSAQASVLISEGLGLGFHLFQSGISESLLAACWHLLAQPSVVGGRGTGVGLGRLTCLKGQPIEESRSRNAWVQGPGSWSAAWVSE